MKPISSYGKTSWCCRDDDDESDLSANLTAEINYDLNDAQLTD